MSNLTKKDIEMIEEGYHTCNEWKENGLFEIMHNGFDLMLDDERCDHDNGNHLRFIFNPDTKQYDSTCNGLTITLDELYESYVTHIGGSNDDLSVPTVWIRPNEEWYEKHKDYFENL